MTNKYNIFVLVAMLIWGTIGIFVKGINLNSFEISFYRSLIGCIFIAGLNLYKRQDYSKQVIKDNIVALILSGISLGLGWGLLFQGYKYTTVSNATLAYYIAPIIIIILSAIIFKESLTKKKFICVISAMIGLVLLIGFNNLQVAGYNHMMGLFYAVLAGIFYALVVIFNKFIKDLPSTVTTMVQLFISALVLLPFIILNGATRTIDARSLTLLIIVGVVHTGIAYTLYLSSIRHLKGQSLAMLSYIDPIFALTLSVIILNEEITLVQIIGGIMILGSAFISEYKLSD